MSAMKFKRQIIEELKIGAKRCEEAKGDKPNAIYFGQLWEYKVIGNLEEIKYIKIKNKKTGQEAKITSKHLEKIFRTEELVLGYTTNIDEVIFVTIV